jgi:hypothetical protein
MGRPSAAAAMTASTTSSRLAGQTTRVAVLDAVPAQLDHEMCATGT